MVSSKDSPAGLSPRSRAARERAGRAAVLAVAVLAAAFVLGAFAAPWLEARGAGAWALVRFCYAPLCHQIDSRALQFAGHAVALCARCTGLYLGGVAGLLLGATLVVGRGREPRPRWFLLAVLPTLIDALLPRVGLPGLPNLPRLLLAVPAGLMAGVFLSIGIFDLISSRNWNRPRRSGPVVEECDG